MGLWQMTRNDADDDHIGWIFGKKDGDYLS